MGLEERKNTVIVGLQWGDEGKGKVVDYLANQFRIMSFDSKEEITQDTHWLSMGKRQPCTWFLVVFCEKYNLHYRKWSCC